MLGLIIPVFRMMIWEIAMISLHHPNHPSNNYISGTSVTGVCASCTKLFGAGFRDFAHQAPPMTRLASEIQSADGAGLANEGALADNPDNGSPTRRRRRGATQ